VRHLEEYTMSQIGGTLVGSYDLRLVALSLFIAILASYVALDLAVRVTAARGRVRRAWLAGGATSMGLGIWSMHFVGMLAFTLPIPVRYELTTVLLSLLAAILTSAVALYIVSGEKFGRSQALASSLAMGGGIAGMHYLGMAAMRLPATCHYNPLLVGLSILIAVVASLAALTFAFNFHEERRPTSAKLTSAAVMGVAIASMHYTGMASVSFVSSNLTVDFSRALSISWLGIAGIVIVTLVTLGFTLLTTFIGGQFDAQTLRLESSEQLARQSRALIDAIPQQIWSGPADGTLDYCNERWRAYMGLGLDELRGDGWQKMLHPDDRERVLRAWKESVANGTPYEQEERHRGADGTYHWFLARGVPLRNAEGRIIRWYGTNTDIQDQREAEEELRHLSGELLRSQDEERRRIARDLHDSTGQNLVALATMLGQFSKSVPSVERKMRTLLSECMALADQCIREVRTLSYELHPPVLDDAGLEDAIRDYVAGFTKRSGILVDLEVSPGFGRLTRDVELALFRVVQESLTNVQRHSGSLRAQIRVARRSDEVTLEIRDTGRDTTDMELKRDAWLPFEVGVGIPSMHERVKLIGGRLNITTGSHGTTVRVTLPAGDERHEEAPDSDS
jgi:PAS domain S-box-containing protein